MTYQDKTTQQVFQENAAFGATRNVTSKVGKRVTPVMLGTILDDLWAGVWQNVNTKRDCDVCKVIHQAFLCSVIYVVVDRTIV